MRHILPGSVEVNGNIITAGVHEGSNEWDLKNLRYIEGDTSKANKGEKLLEFLSRIYDNSTGCLIHKTFKVN